MEITIWQKELKCYHPTKIQLDLRRMNGRKLGKNYECHAKTFSLHSLGQGLWNQLSSGARQVKWMNKADRLTNYRKLFPCTGGATW